MATTRFIDFGALTTTLEANAKNMVREHRLHMTNGDLTSIAISKPWGRQIVYPETVSLAMVLKFAPSVEAFLQDKNGHTTICLPDTSSVCDNGVRMLINWMSFSSLFQTSKPLGAPSDLLHAIQLHNALKAFLLLDDARRIHSEIEFAMISKLLITKQIRSIWINLPHDNEFVYLMIDSIKDRRENKTVANMRLVESDPELLRRVTVPGENEKFRHNAGSNEGQRVFSKEGVCFTEARNAALEAELECNPWCDT